MIRVGIGTVCNAFDGYIDYVLVVLGVLDQLRGGGWCIPVCLLLYLLFVIITCSMIRSGIVISHAMNVLRIICPCYSVDLLGCVSSARKWSVSTRRG